MKPNPKAIEALKRVMTPKQIKQFLKECRRQRGLTNDQLNVLWESEKRGTLIIRDFYIHAGITFPWHDSIMGFDYWREIFALLTLEEKALKLFIK